MPPMGGFKTMPSPDPFTFEASSVKRTHTLDDVPDFNSSFSASGWVGVTVCDCYLVSYSPSGPGPFIGKSEDIGLASSTANISFAAGCFAYTVLTSPDAGNLRICALKHRFPGGIGATDDHVDNVLWFFLLVLLADIPTSKMALCSITQKLPKVRTGLCSGGDLSRWVGNRPALCASLALIGSLGSSNNEAGVVNITVTNSVFTKTQNGVRVKSWARPSGTYAKNLMFRNLIMRNVGYPIIIDQNYCPDNSCPHQNSGVKVSQVTYKNVKGTSSTQVAMKFDCSYTNPCTGIKLQDIKLTHIDRLRRPAILYCRNARGRHSGTVIPKGCF
uniref:Polygalacturonase-2-like n=1 Tax=Nicotiana tabacum TaxID=4097 RepID=A0A1S3Y7T1_TOBAC|nr:PREDICTED: polygalacturonase-2-like [Nicotiana tabacum]